MEEHFHSDSGETGRISRRFWGQHKLSNEKPGLKRKSVCFPCLYVVLRYGKGCLHSTYWWPNILCSYRV